MCRSFIVPCLAVVFFGFAPSFADDPADPPWTYLGLAGTEIHSVQSLLGDLYVGAADGLHIMLVADGTWRDLVREGVAGWPVTAVGRSPRYLDRVVTGRVDGEGGGALAITYLADGATELRLEQQSGPFARIKDTGYFSHYLLWACTPGGEGDGVVLASSSGGEVWEELAGHGFSSPRAFSSTVMVVGKEIVTDTVLCGDGGVRSTLDDGQSWSPYEAGLPETTVYDVLVADVCVPDADTRKVSCNWYFAATDSGLYFKETKSAPWSRVLPDPCTKVLFDDVAHQQGRVYLLTSDRRVLGSGLTADLVWEWEDLAADLVPAEITDINIGPYRLLAGTAAHGVFEKVWPDGTDVPASDLRLALDAAPNPFNPTTTLSFVAPQCGNARLAIFDLHGRLVATVLEGDIAAGPVSRVWRPRDLASGVYVARLQLNGAVSLCRVALIR